MQNKKEEIKECIKEFQDDTYVDEAEAVFENLSQEKELNKLTTTQIRNLLSLTANLYDEIQVKKFEELTDKINYLRVQFVYQSGRNKSVEYFVKKAGIIDLLKNRVKNKVTLIRFCRYMEALVAYFKYNGGNDK
ncbi:type III-A CRISPR-associated protein Csm2 [Pilibacter termitis]